MYGSGVWTRLSGSSDQGITRLLRAPQGVSGCVPRAASAARLLRAAGRGHPQLRATGPVRRAALGEAAARRLLRVRRSQTRLRSDSPRGDGVLLQPMLEDGAWEAVSSGRGPRTVAADFPSQPVACAVLTTVASSGPVLRGCSLLLAKPNAMGTVVHPGRPHRPSVLQPRGTELPAPLRGCTLPSPPSGVGSRASPSPGVGVPSVRTTRLRRQPACLTGHPPRAVALWAARPCFLRSDSCVFRCSQDTV